MNEETVEMGSGNVWRDLGFENPELEQLRSALSFEIYTLIKQRKWDAAKIAQVLGISVSQAETLLTDAAFSDFSDVDRLFEFLNRLDISIDIYLKPSPQGGAYQQLHATT